MSRRTRLVVAFAICLAIVGGYGLLARKPEDSKARTPPPVDDEPLRLRGFDGLVLLSDARVQQELRISASQRSSIAKIANDFLEDLRPAVVAARGLQQRSKQDQVGLWSYINARRLQAARERTAEATAMLTPRQRQRLNQVAFQLRLEEVFYEPDVVQALSLTESQKRQIAEGRERLLQQARLVHQATKRARRP